MKHFVISLIILVQVKPAVTPNIVDVSSAVDRQQLKALLQTAIGSNYYMVYGKRMGH